MRDLSSSVRAGCRSVSSPLFEKRNKDCAQMDCAQMDAPPLFHLTPPLRRRAPDVERQSHQPQQFLFFFVPPVRRGRWRAGACAQNPYANPLLYSTKKKSLCSQEPPTAGIKPLLREEGIWKSRRHRSQPSRCRSLLEQSGRAAATVAQQQW